MAQKAPKPPSGLATSGRALWSSLLDAYELDEHERTLLREACRTADSLDGLQELLDDEGLMAKTSQGPKAHPALIEARQQRIAFARLLAALRIPTGETSERTQHRGGPRGVYGIRGAV